MRQVFDPLIQKLPSQVKVITSVVIRAITTIATGYYGPMNPVPNSFLAIVISGSIYQIMETSFSQDAFLPPLLRKIPRLLVLGMFPLVYFSQHNHSNAKVAEIFLFFSIGTLFKKFLTNYAEINYNEYSAKKIKDLSALALAGCIIYLHKE